jgi:phytol kinase
MLTNVWLALAITFILALVWLRANDFAAHRGWISNQLSRKIIHAGTGPIFVACWVLFPDIPSSRYLAALVPLLFTIQFFLIGIGLIKDQASVEAMSRTGNPRDILRGPLFYGIIFTVLTIIFWIDNPIGIVALMILCGGDGFADIIGRRWGKKKLPYNPDKSWAGSVGMLLGSWIFSIVILWYFIGVNLFPGPILIYLPAISIIGLACTLVESLPVHDLDNITITITAVLLGMFFF